MNYKSFLTRIGITLFPKRIIPYIEGALRKWDCIAQGIGTDEGMWNCPLCQVFVYARGTNKCKGCPVFKRTGAKGCSATPYRYFYVRNNQTLPHYMQNSYNPSKHIRQCDVVEDAIEFLVSLLPEDHPWRKE